MARMTRAKTICKTLTTSTQRGVCWMYCSLGDVGAPYAAGAALTSCMAVTLSISRAACGVESRTKGQTVRAGSGGPRP